MWIIVIWEWKFCHEENVQYFAYFDQINLNILEKPLKTIYRNKNKFV